MDTEIQAGADRSANNEAVADGGEINQNGIAAASHDAGQTAIDFKGLKGGKARTDGLIPGSQAARDADKKRDRERKAKSRMAAKADPPALPAASNTDSPRPDAVDTVQAVSVAPAVPWAAKSLLPLLESLADFSEEYSVSRLKTIAEEKKLPGPVIAMVEKDARWHPAAKVAFIESGADVAAKHLNKLGVSAEYQPELTLAGALLAIVAGHVRLTQRLELLAQASKQ